MDLRSGYIRSMIRRMLVIGGTSAIGKALCPLLEKKYDVYSVGSSSFSLPMCNPDWSKFDMVINLAAILTEGYLDKDDIMDKLVIDVNCLGSVRILNTFLPYMKGQGFGRIIMMSSVYSAINVRGQGIYSATKAFVDKLVKIAAIENAEYGVTVNSIQLGYTGIGMGEMTEGDSDRALARIGMKRFVTIEEIYKTIDYIVNTEYLTGQNIRLDGGIR